jgi:thioredoxin reductase (NADPH)
MDRRPTLLTVGDDARLRDRLADDLRRRYEPDYLVVTASGEEARSLSASAELLLLAAVVAPAALEVDGSGLGLMAEVHRTHPDARRLMLVARGEWRDHPVRRAMALGHLDGYIFSPWQPREEWLYLPMAEQLAEWSRTQEPDIHAVTIVGHRWDEHSHHLRDLMSRASIPFAFREPGIPEGRAELTRMGLDDSLLPAVRFHTGAVSAAPSDTEVVQLLGFRPGASDERWDVAIVGAGPAGMSAAVYAASEGLRAVVVDPSVPGGQAGTSSRIRNYLGFPHGLSGAELTTRAVEQSWLFGAEFLLAHQAVELRTSASGHQLITAHGTVISARTVVLATGVTWRRLDVPSIEAFVGAGVFYGAAGSEAAALRGEHVVVVGGGNSAGQAAVHLAKHADSVRVIVRGPSLAASMSDYLISQLTAIPHLSIEVSAELIDAGGDGRLERLTVRSRTDGRTRDIDAAALFVMIGAVPHTEWLGADFARGPGGYLSTGEHVAGIPAWPLDRAPYYLETCRPGVFAVGDVRQGAVRRVAPSVGTGAIAIQLVHQYLAEAPPTAERAGTP